MKRHLNWILAGLMFILGFSSISYAKDDELATKVNVSTISMPDRTNNAGNSKTVVPLSVLSPKAGDFAFSTQAYLLCQSDMPDNMQDKSTKPPLSPRSIAAEVVVGISAGLVTGTALTYVTGNDIGGFVLGFLAGEIIGTTTTVYCIGSIGDQAGSFWITLLGTLGGMVASGEIAEFSKWGSDWPAVFFIVLPAVGATVAFNLTRRYETPPFGSTIMNIQNGNLSFAIPAISIHRNGKGFTSKVGLISFSF